MGVHKELIPLGSPRVKFTPPAQLNVFDFLFNRGGIPRAIPLGLALPALLNQSIFNWGGISAGRWNPLQPALVHCACVLHADRLGPAHLRGGLPGYTVWARACPGASCLECNAVVAVV